MARAVRNSPGIPRTSDLLDFPRGICPALIAPSTRCGLSRLDLPQLSKPLPYSLFDELAALPDRNELPHLLQESVFENNVHPCHTSTSDIHT